MNRETDDRDKSAQAAPEQYIWVLGTDDGTSDRGLSGPGRGGDRGFRDDLAQSLGLKRKQVPVAQLADELGRFMGAVEGALERIPNALGSYDLDEIALSVEISAEGSVSLLGTGGKLGGSSGIALKLMRRKGAAVSG